MQKRADPIRICPFFLSRSLALKIVVFVEAPCFTLQLVYESLDLALYQATHIVEAHTRKGGVDLLFEVQVTQFDGCGHAAKGQGGDKAVVDLAQLQALGNIPFKAQFAAGGGNIQQLASNGSL